jgi:23S rRNA (cytidine1920-2'-O)/16S rRNA (cytidine1409-2'-O)-methyltransferase
MAGGRKRLDLVLVERGLAPSRERARALILAGEVEVGGQQVFQPSTPVAADAEVRLRQPPPYVSRGGQKLAHALDRFAVDPAGRVCLDVGASTGGFTDCLLQRGARRVYAVDVGFGQLDLRLRHDPRVVVLERTNIRSLTSLPERPSLATLDLSFISLRLALLPTAALLTEDADIVALVKPQFEAGRSQVGKGGVVRDPAVHRRVLADLAAWCTDHGLSVQGITASPLRGPAGNVEFFLHLRPNAPPPASELIEHWIEAALAEAPPR